MARQPTGTEIIAAMKKGVTWGTPVACGAGDGLLVLSEGIESSPEALFDASLGNPFTECSDVGNITAEGSLEANLKVEGLLLPLALCMGTAGVPSIVTNGYQHYLKCADNIEDLFATLAIDKVSKIHEWPSVKVNSFTISGEAGGYTTIEFEVIANTLDDASVVNTAITMANVTFTDKCRNIIFGDGVFLLKDHLGAAPGIGDQVFPSGFELSFNRNVSGDFVANGTREIIEPQQDNQPEINLTLTFPRYTDTRFITDMFTRQYHELIATWVGPLIGAGPDLYTFVIQLPKMHIISAPVPTEGLGKMPFDVEYRCLASSSIPTGFQDANPVTLGFLNTITTNPLA